MAQTFHKMLESGAGNIAYVFFVSGYPWAVTTHPALVTALDGTSDDQKFVREFMFGRIEINDTPSYKPAWDVPIIPTLMDDLGSETWTADPTKGFLKSSGWRVNILDHPPGEDWEHKATGDEIWGLEGVHRVAQLHESDIHGWGYLGTALPRVDIDGDPPSSVKIIEESSGRLYNRIDALGSGEWIPIWINQECIGVSSVTGSFGIETEYTAVITKGETSQYARGLYKSMPANHSLGLMRGTRPVVRDVPPSIANGYAWLYAVPLTEAGDLIEDSDGNPIVAIKRQGVVSPDIETKDGVTSIRMRPATDAAKIDVEAVEQVSEASASLTKYVICRGWNSGTTEASLVPYWQCPHLLMATWIFDSGPEVIPIWICRPGQTRTFDNYYDLFEEITEEINDVWNYSDNQRTGHGTSGDFAKPTLKFMSLDDGIFEEDWQRGGMVGFSGPLAWVLGLGYPGIVGVRDSGWPDFERGLTFEEHSFYAQYKHLNYNQWMYDLECIGEKMRGPGHYFASPEMWLTTTKYSMAFPSGSSWWYNAPGYYEENGMRAKYYYQWDWVNHPLDEWEDYPRSYPRFSDVADNTYFQIPMIDTDGGEASTLCLDENTYEGTFSNGETVHFGRGMELDKAPRLEAELSAAIDEDDDEQDVPLMYVTNNRLETVDTDTFNTGGSLFFHPFMQQLAVSDGDTQDGVSDPFLIQKAIDLQGVKLSDILRAMFGETRAGVTVPPEVQLSSVPFFTTIDGDVWDYGEDFVSIIDWDSMDRNMQHIPGAPQYYSLNIKKARSVYDILKNEVLLHGCMMTREWDFTNLQWVIRFRPIEPMNKSEAYFSGRTITETNMTRDGKSSTHNAVQIANEIQFKSEWGNVPIPAVRSLSSSSEHATIVIEPAISQFDWLSAVDSPTDVFGFVYETLVKFYYPIVLNLAQANVSNTATLTMRGLFSAILGRESLVTDPAAKNPLTGEPGITERAARIVKWSENLSNHTLKVTYNTGNESFGWPPTCRLTSGNFTTHTTYWWGVPEDHDYTDDSEAKDMYFFDCYDLADPTNPIARTSCGCGDYAVYATAEDEIGATRYAFTCDVVSDGGTMKLRLTGGNTTSIDTGKDYVITFQAYDSCEGCQQKYVFGADMNNYLGSSNDPARRWTS